MEEQASPPPPKKKRRGEGGKARKQPTAAKPPANTTRGAQTPPPEGTEDRTPKEAQGDHPPKTGNTKPGTAAHREKGHRNKQKKKREPAAQPKRKGPQGPSQEKKKKKNAQKSHPDNPAKRNWAQPRPGPSTHAQTSRRSRKRRGASGGPRNHTRPISRPKPNPNHEHHKQPTLEGQHHKPCPNTPTQDPSQDWRG